MGGTKFTAWCRLSIRFANRPRDDCMIGNNDKPVVFVIDDDPSIREALDGLIRSIKLDVYTFGTTDEFLNFNRPDAPGCIVLDIDSLGSTDSISNAIWKNQISIFQSSSSRGMATFRCLCEPSRPVRSNF